MLLQKAKAPLPPDTFFKLIVCEDNEATVRIVLKKRSQALRHLRQTHRVNLDWLYEAFDTDEIKLKYARTNQQIADVLTKHFSNQTSWMDLLSLLGLRRKRPAGNRNKGIVAICSHICPQAACTRTRCPGKRRAMHHSKSMATGSASKARGSIGPIATTPQGPAGAEADRKSRSPAHKKDMDVHICIVCGCSQESQPGSCLRDRSVFCTYSAEDQARGDPRQQDTKEEGSGGPVAAKSSSRWAKPHHLKE